MARSEQQIQAGRTPLGLWWSLTGGFCGLGLSISVSATCSNSTVVQPVIITCCM